MQPDFSLAPAEFKFADTAAGTFSGYGAVFGNVDSHGDLIVPGAFKDSLAERKAQGRRVPLHVMHGIYGGDGLPAGVLNSVEEDDKGLRIEGKISGATTTDAGRRLYELLTDGGFGGFSIGYSVKKNGAVYGQKPGEPKRTLKALNLGEISLVDDPSNPQAVVNEMKRLARNGYKLAGEPGEPGEGMPFEADTEEAIECLTAAIILQDKLMTGYTAYYGGSVKDAALLMDHLRGSFQALTGERVPDGLDGWAKSVPHLREIERVLREEGKLSHSRATAVAKRLVEAAPRDGGSDPANRPEAKSALTDLGGALTDFKLP